jgi:hypothetical protein
MRTHRVVYEVGTGIVGLILIGGISAVIVQRVVLAFQPQ